MAVTVDRFDDNHVKVRFTLPVADPPGRVSVVGTFNGWTPGLDELLDRGDGTRCAVIGLPYGQRFVFRYLAEDGRWFDEPGGASTADGSTAGPFRRPRHAP